MTDRYAVIGNPVAHSKSPQIHAAFALETAQDLHYERLLAPLDGFAATVQRFRSDGGRGCNVTVPFKLEAFCLAQAWSDRARDAGAANTLDFRGEGIFADNTDGAGLLRDLMVNLGTPLQDKRVLLLGAGGASQGVLGPLLEQRPAELVVANRTPHKASQLVEKLPRRATGTRLTGCGFGELAGRNFEVVVNATSSSLSDELPPLPNGLFAEDSLAYDMMYGKGLSPFLRFAQMQGATRCADGLGMLVEQAAESFLLWRGVRPSTRSVIDSLRSP